MSQVRISQRQYRQIVSRNVGEKQRAESAAPAAKAVEARLCDSFRTVTEPVTVRLPYPPALNHYWRHAIIGGHVSVYTSAAGKAYRREVVELWPQLAGRVTFAGPLAVQIVAAFPDARARDLDGIPKALLDALAHAGAFRDDHQVRRLILEAGPVDPPGHVTVTIGTKPGAERQATLFGLEW